MVKNPIHVITIEIDRFTNHSIECSCTWNSGPIEYHDQIAHQIALHLDWHHTGS